MINLDRLENKSQIAKELKNTNFEKNYWNRIEAGYNM